MSPPISRARGRATTVLGVALSLLLWPRFAWAYLDPGTGSYIFQMAVAAALASMFTMRLYWQKVKDWARALRPGAVEVKPDEPPAEPPAAN